MKRLLIVVGIMTMFLFLGGQIWKAKCPDGGVSKLQTYEDTRSITCPLGGYCDMSQDDLKAAVDNMRKYKEENLRFYDKSQVDLIVVARPTGNLTSYYNCLVQEMEITKVISGDKIQKGEICELNTYNGFCARTSDRKLGYCSSKCVMNPDCEYLVFMNRPVRQNRIGKPYYVTHGEWSYFNLSKEYSVVVNVQDGDAEYKDYADSEFLLPSKELLDLILDMKQQIVSKYI